MDATRTAAPPGFLRLVAHPLRWRLLLELASGDRRVRELTAVLAQPQSLVSYHLGRLRAAGIVSARRSSADGRDAYYSIDLARCGELLATAGAALHPALRLTAPSPAPAAGRARVLFLCTGNSARSQVAEALLERLAGGTVEVRSAGSHPKPIHPGAVEVLRDRGIELGGRRSKHLSEFAADRFDYVVSLCDRVREVCPELPGPPERIHWSIPDPALEGDTEDALRRAFERLADDLETRIRFFLHVIRHAPREVD